MIGNIYKRYGIVYNHGDITNVFYVVCNLRVAGVGKTAQHMFVTVFVYILQTHFYNSVEHVIIIIILYSTLVKTQIKYKTNYKSHSLQLGLF